MVYAPPNLSAVGDAFAKFIADLPESLSAQQISEVAELAHRLSCKALRAETDAYAKGWSDALASFDSVTKKPAA